MSYCNAEGRRGQAPCPRKRKGGGVVDRIGSRIGDQAGRLEYLLHFLRDENPRCRDMEIPDDGEGRRRLLRALMNVRPPWPIGGDFLEVQDAYLREETRRKGIVDAEALPVAAGEPGASSLSLWRGDITTLRADAVVNAANASLLGCFVPGHGCIDNVIHTYAGVQLRLECDALMRRQGHEEPTGGAKITGAYNLPSRHVVHTVGPIVADRPTRRDRALLADCYRSCLELARSHRLASIAFCCISTGEFRFPQQEAAEIAVETVRGFLREHGAGMRVIFDVFKESDHDIYRRLLGCD